LHVYKYTTQRTTMQYFFDNFMQNINNCLLSMIAFKTNMI